jgi:hypothetical protein
MPPKRGVVLFDAGSSANKNGRRMSAKVEIKVPKKLVGERESEAAAFHVFYESDDSMLLKFAPKPLDHAFQRRRRPR